MNAVYSTATGLDKWHDQYVFSEMIPSMVRLRTNMVQTSKMAKKNKRDISPTISLAPLGFEDAVRAALSTGKAPPAPKRPKPKGKK
jgi:hypothetical protein